MNEINHKNNTTYISDVSNTKVVGKHRRLGQAMLEYTIVAGMLVAVFFMMTLFIAVFREYGTRILDMVAADYP